MRGSTPHTIEYKLVITTPNRAVSLKITMLLGGGVPYHIVHNNTSLTCRNGNISAC